MDNLAKFVLDSMNKLVYEDDKQVVKLVVCKLFDSEHGCNGRTVVELAKFDEKIDLETLTFICQHVRSPCVSSTSKA